MLYNLGQILVDTYGPFRLFTSFSFLIFSGTVVAFLASLITLPRFNAVLPHDRGKEFAVQASVSKGKPTGSGVIFITVFVLVSLLFVPLRNEVILVLALTYLAMLSGYLDDRSEKPWGEYFKGLIDFLLALVGAIILARSRSVIWLPFIAGEFAVPAYVFIPVGVIILWTSINSTNCTDGVDGLSSSLVLLGLLSMGVFMYFVIGHTDISEHLLLPHYPDAAVWAVMVFVMVGCLSGYLWYNAYPSEILMGDAGSRAIGFFLGCSILLARNPFLLFIVGTVILVNGGTGLLKVTLLRFLNVNIFHSIRFPLHDHFRNVREWSNTQVLIRFSLVQILLIIVLFGMFLKIR